MQPLPGGALPADQTLEGGAQIRVTQSGFQKLTSIIPAIVNDQFAGGFCVPRGETGSPNSTFGTGAEWCHTNDSGCTPGCKVNVGLNSLNVSVVGNQRLRVTLSASINTTLRARGQVIGIPASCTLGVTSNDLGGSFDIDFGIDQATGELDLHLAQINDFHLNTSFSGCGLISDIANLADDIVESFLGEFIIDLLTPTIDDLLQSVLPDPLGIAGMLDVGALVGGISSGTEGYLETRIVPGGYVRLDSQSRGLSLGVITGFNADEDITTRTGTRPDGVPFASEPSLCVPPLPTPQFGAPPASLPLTARQTFSLAPAGELDGMPDPQADVAMGVSETFLDLTGHHLVTSGAMCLGIGTSTVEQLNVGTIGLLVQSLTELTSEQGTDPLLLVTRPQKAIDFTIGDNTAASPAITLALHNFEVDFYAFLFERYVRAFTLDLTLNVGVNLEFEQMPGGPVVIKPTLVGLSSSEVQVRVLNSEFVREKPEDLEAVLPSVFDLVTPLLGNIPPIEVPSFAGFSLNNLSIQHVTTSQDDFLALYASLGASTMMRVLAERDLFAHAAVARLDHGLRPAQAPSTGRARHVATVTPEPAKVRAALTGKADGAMPEVTFEVDRFDAQGRELEWAYNLNGGMYRPFQATPDGTLVVRDPAFAWQGKYTIGLKSRVKGDYRTVAYEAETPVIIDSVGPRISVDKQYWDGDVLRVPMWDIVSEGAIRYALGAPGEDAPSSPWVTGTNADITRADLEKYAVDGELVVYAMDEAGNQTIALVAPFHGQAQESGCGGCDTSGTPAGGIVLALFVGFLVLGRGASRRRVLAVARAVPGRRVGRFVSTFGLWLGVSTVMSLAPGCSCGDSPAQSCEVVDDCPPCDRGELPYCLDNVCGCSDDLPPGRIGPYSDVAIGGGQIWVSAYAQSYGDLVVAKVEPGRVPHESWEWVDGVPDVTPTIPNSMIRGGIDAKGPDVGMYTSIAVSADGTPSVTYFDRETGSLKFAQKVGGSWQIHTVQSGTGPTIGEFGEHAGMYTSLTLRSDDGRPGVAYLAHVRDADSARAEVRYAAAQTPTPTSPDDWQFWVVDTAPLPPDDGIYPLPEGLGLFIDSARLPDQAPVVVYYDRGAGDLKLARFNPASGEFAAPVLLDGGSTDAGWSPSVAVDAEGVVHVAYVGSTRDDLMYVTDRAGAAPEIVDDGYRIVGTTTDGLPKPEFHFVGDDASLVIAGGTPMVAYQDATTQELLLATRQPDGIWTWISVAGATDPWPGAYGFFASSGMLGNQIVMSNWVLNPPATDPYDSNWVEVFARQAVVE